MRCRHCHFPCVNGETYWEKLYLSEFAANFLGGFFNGWTEVPHSLCRVAIGSLLPVKYIFHNCKKTIWETVKKISAREYGCLYCTSQSIGVEGRPLKNKKVLSSILKTSAVIIISPKPYVFTLTPWQIAILTDHQRLILKVKKPVEVPI
jgi:hypothetical protein